MARSYHSVNSFKNGELSEKLNGRFDIQEYANGVAQMENFFPMPSGGARNRPGSRYFADITTFGACRVVGVSTEDNDYLLLIRDDAGVAFFDVYDTAGNNGSVASNYLGTSYNAKSKEGWRFAAAKIGGSDRLVMTHLDGDVPPVIVTFSAAPSIVVAPWIADSNTTWGSTSAVGEGFEPLHMRVPYGDFNRTTTTITPSAASGSGITLTASASLFASTDVGRRVRINHSSSEGVAVITAYTSATQVTADVEVSFSATTASGDWAMAMWSDTEGWPRVVVNHNQRLIFAGSPAYPDTIWDSIAGSPGFFMQQKLAQDSSTNATGYNYFGDISDADAFSFRLASDPGRAISRAIQWLATGDTLEFGTGAIEGVITSVDGRYGPLHFDVRTRTYNGGGDTQAAKGARSTFYVSRDGKAIKEFVYSPRNGSHVSRNLSILASDIYQKNLTSGAAAAGISNFYFKEMAWQDSRSILWSLVNTEPGDTEGGVLVGITFEPDTETVGWHRHDLAESDRLHGITTMANDDNKYDRLYLVVERTVDGSTKYYLEFLGNDFEGSSLSGITSSDDDDYPWFLDSSVRVTNSPASTSVSGLSHLEGEEVYAWADGTVVGPFTVSSGAITLDTAAEEIIVGLKYTSKLKSMDLNFRGPSGDTPQQVKDSSKVILKLYRSFGGSYGPDENTLSDLEYDTSDLYTGNLRLDLENSPGEEFRYYIEQNDPYPFILLGAFFRGVVGGGD